MKKVSILLTAVIACATMFISWKKATEAALHIGPFVCNMVDGDGNFGAPGTGRGVVTSSNNGNYVCKGTLPNSTGGVVHWSDEVNPIAPGTQYGTPNGQSTSWHTTIAPNGKATLIVKVHP